MLSLRPSLTPGGVLQVLCVGAHSDDIEIGCGGTILRLLAEYPRVAVRWVVLSADDTREAEARASAEAFLAGAEEAQIDVLHFRESYLPFMASEVKDHFEVLKQSCRPDIVFTHHRHDLHQDHQLVSQLTWNTFRDHVVLEYEIPKWDGDLGRPNVFVPLAASVAARKIDLLCEHFASQRSRSWFDPETFTALMRLRAMECNAPDRRAEAFHGPKLALL
jgi:LmbE family N-acetylglucosaminyl deacetylase